jgi:hypothetical protein
LSVQLNHTCTSGVIPHDIETYAEFREKAENLVRWAKLLWNWRGKGDYFYAIFEQKAAFACHIIFE